MSEDSLNIINNLQNKEFTTNERLNEKNQNNNEGENLDERQKNENDEN